MAELSGVTSKACIKLPWGIALPIEAAICGILVGSLGVHKFVIGNTTAGLIMLLVTLLTCGFGGIVMHAIGLVEGIIYLTKTDEEFYQTYVVEKKQWF